MTGAGWQKPRTNLRRTRPAATGIRTSLASSPSPHTAPARRPASGVYEGSLLPKVFHNQIIHCDALPSVVRSYPAIPDGAGYKVTQTSHLDGAKRTDGPPRRRLPGRTARSSFTDWYDPGVGATARATWTAAVFSGGAEGVKYTGAEV